MVSFPPLSPPKTYTLPSSRGYIIILSTHLRLGLPSGLFPTGFPTKTLNTPTTPKIHPNIINPSTPRSAEPVSQQRPYTLPCTQTSILKLYTILRPGLPSALFPYGFPTKTQYTPSPHPYAPNAQPISFFSILSPAQYWVSSTNLQSVYRTICVIPLCRSSGTAEQLHGPKGL